MADLITSAAGNDFIQVIMIDLELAGDNAVVIGLAAAGLSAKQRKRAFVIGIVIATALRIVFTSSNTTAADTRLVLAGDLLLFWVCWKMWRELHKNSTLRKGRNEPSVDGRQPQGSRSSHITNRRGRIGHFCCGA
jgi:predicted tellurium resistance membrane protein TerC